ncbi:MAG: 1,4-dihydroxy-2-naphthoate polyprenyltransferase [Pasteurellales bacterium]|nr:MAG: 1,4-dihydroxy-2-naphthoate polyprenyltransferase [Pasteurellales bacterium]
MNPYLQTARLKTLLLSIASIATMGSVSYFLGNFKPLIFFLTLTTALLLQILSNFANDYGDLKKGSDIERIGEKRAIHLNQISEFQLKKAIYYVIGLSIISGFLLIMVSVHSLQDFIVFISLGLLSIVASITYTVGKKPYGYCGLGDLSVLIFFGFIAIFGGFYLQNSSVHYDLFFPSLGAGLLAVGVLNINNLRDARLDSVNNKNTLIVKMGITYGKVYHFILLSLALLSFIIFALVHHFHFYGYLFLLSIPLFYKNIKAVITFKDGLELKPYLAQMAKTAFICQMLFVIGVCLH